MIAVYCPSCKSPMEIEENEPNTEWECPTCGAAFLVRASADGSLEVTVTQAATRQVRDRSAGNSIAVAERDPAIKDEVYVQALESLLNGAKPKEVRKDLIAAGYSASQADGIVRVARNYQKENAAQEKLVAQISGDSGQRNMMIGAIVFLIGIVVTFGSMSFAAEAGGGRYVLAWGAIVFGGIQFVRGWMQYSSK